jgi:hypothetical protein
VKTLICSALAVSGLLYPEVSFATVLSIWDFGDSSAVYTERPAYYNTAAEPILVLAGGAKDIDGKNGIALVDADGVSHIAGQSGGWDDIKVSGNPSASWITTINTAGFQDLAIRWDYKSEKATSFDLAYRVTPDGSWTQIVDNYPITTGWSANAWYAVSLDLSSYAVLNNQTYVQLRVDDLVEGPGNDKFTFDNLQITGVPEPSALLFLWLGCVIWVMRKQGGLGCKPAAIKVDA